MKNKIFAVAAVGLAAVLVAGGLVASNMGFKANYLLNDPDGGATSLSGTAGLALPYNQQTSLLDAEDLIADINADGGAICLSPNPSCVESVGRLDPATDLPVTYTGSAGTNFPLTAGEGYNVVINANGGDINYIIVGSHNPVLDIVLRGPADPGSLSGTQLWSYPYHSTAVDAEDLIQEIHLTAPGSVESVGRRDRTTDLPVTYTGTSGTNFLLTPGESYTIVVNQNVTFVPAHY